MSTTVTVRGVSRQRDTITKIALVNELRESLVGNVLDSHREFNIADKNVSSVLYNNPEEEGERNIAFKASLRVLSVRE